MPCVHLRYVDFRDVFFSGPIIAQILTTFHLDREKNHRCALSQPRTSVNNEHIVIYTNVFAWTQMSKINMFKSHRDPNGNSIWTILSEHMLLYLNRQWDPEIVSPEIYYRDLTLS